MYVCMYVCMYVGDYRLEECPIPEVGDEEVLVKVLAVGVCSSDAKCFAGAAYYWGEVCSHGNHMCRFYTGVRSVVMVTTCIASRGL